MTNNDYTAFMAADFPLTLEDGITIDVVIDEDAFGMYPDDETGTEYVGVIIKDTETDAYDALWAIDVLPHQSGHDVRQMLWDNVVGGYHEMLRNVREQRDRERKNAADAAARDIVTV